MRTFIIATIMVISSGAIAKEPPHHYHCHTHGGLTTCDKIYDEEPQWKYPDLHAKYEEEK
jgi:hypothetical protein